jgi:hypothetical protein
MATKNSRTKPRHAAALTADEIAKLREEEQSQRATRVIAEIQAILERERCRIEPHLVYAGGALREKSWAVIAD